MIASSQRDFTRMHGLVDGNSAAAEQAALRQATVGKATLFRERNQLFDVRTQFLRLGDSGGDLLMLDESRRHVAEQSRAV